MRLRLRFTEPALGDLEHIREWLSGEASPQVAANQLERVAVALRRLRDFPRIAPLEQGAVRRKSIRRSPYLIFYRVEDDAVVILRIRHNREDWHSSE